MFDVLLLPAANCILLNDKFVVCPLNFDSISRDTDNESRSRLFAPRDRRRISRTETHGYKQ